MISLNNLTVYAGDNFNQNKYKEGHRIYRGDNDGRSNIFECGLMESADDNLLKVKSLSLRTSHLKDGFYEINGCIQKDGKIISFKCTCPAGESGQCKHILGTLFLCLK